MIIALFVAAILGLSYYLISYNSKNKSVQATKESSELKDTDIVKSYAESCLKSASEDALFNRIGMHGGYIEPNGDPIYQENPIPDDQKTSFLSSSVPYYLEADCKGACAFKESIPKESEIRERLGNYILVEFQKCLNATIFEEIGINITKPAQNINVDVILNKDDVSVKLNYPLAITKITTKDKAKATLDFFSVTLPIRLKSLYSISIELLQKIEAAKSDDYTLTPADCTSFDKNGLTNVYIKNSDNGPKEIVQFVDFSTYEKYYFHSYVFQFAVKKIKINGICTG